MLLLTAQSWGQPIEPKRPALPPSYPTSKGAVIWPPDFKPRLAPVTSMKLLAPNVGWALSMRRVLWTDNGGTSWKDITPPASTEAAISSVFFLDPNRGWVLLAQGEPDVSNGTSFEIAATGDGGSRWSTMPLTVPGGTGFAHAGIVTFADSFHGWLGLQAGMNTSTMDVGELLVTDDGGKTWRATVNRGKDSFHVGPMLMVTPQFGWAVGAGTDSPLEVTRDGGRTWQTVSLESPVETDQMREYDRRRAAFWTSFKRSNSPRAKERGAKALSQHQTYAAYDLPVFKDPKHGNISVTYPGVVVLFTTNDGGITWKPDRILTGLREHSTGSKVASVVADSAWITGTAPGKEMPHLRILEPGANVADATMPAPEASGILQMSFVSPRDGWILTSETALQSTNDGGATWTDISPPR
jgi:photosystem II stability/assembly factor-like uncharacterized protein